LEEPLRLIAQIEKKFARKLPVTAIFQSPTIEQLACILRGNGEWTPVSSLVEIQRGGKRPPLVLVHGVGGGMFWGYSNLAHHLDPEQPVFAFKSRGMDGQEEFETIEEMAAHYVNELRRFQAHGPYYLGGHSAGGILAYEMARQLQEQGEPVALLAILDSPAPATLTRQNRGAEAGFDDDAAYRVERTGRCDSGAQPPIEDAIQRIHHVDSLAIAGEIHRLGRTQRDAPTRQDRANEAEGHVDQHDERKRPTLERRREHEQYEHESDARRDDEVVLRPLLLLGFTCELCPGVAMRRAVARENRLHIAGHRLDRARARIERDHTHALAPIVTNGGARRGDVDLGDVLQSDILAAGRTQQ